MPRRIKFTIPEALPSISLPFPIPRLPRQPQGMVLAQGVVAQWPRGSVGTLGLPPACPGMDSRVLLCLGSLEPLL